MARAYVIERKLPEAEWDSKIYIQDVIKQMIAKDKKKGFE